MVSIRQFLQFPFLIFSAFVVPLYFLFIWKRQRFHEVPQASGAWPILGHLHLLSGSELPHKLLGAMADKYGPIFTFRIGVHRAVVVSSWEVAKECYTTNDRAFASRPLTTTAKIMSYNYAMFSFSPYGPYWREIRKIAMSQLLSNLRLELLKDVRDTEINTSIKELYEGCVRQNKANGVVLLELREWFGDLTLNIILRMVAGERFVSADSESRRSQKASRDFMSLLGMFMLEDAVPYIGWLGFNGSKELRNTAKDLDLILQRWLDEHKQKRLLSGEGKGEGDFMDVMISILEDSKIIDFHNDTIIKATCSSIITGGNDTVMLTLTWILSLLLNNKEALKKAQDELDAKVGKDRQVNESDIKNLVYLEAIIKETLRLYPAGPLSGPRIATEDCTLSGYHVRAGTQLVVNLWKIQRDPSVWSNPSEFKPERFLTDHVGMDVKGQHYELMPFGSGRRACPGISFALQVIPLVMARLLHGFEINSHMDMPVDMTETPGLSNIKATPLEVVIKPRLQPQIYEL